MTDSLGIYVSVPFCRGKCSFCHFASDVFPIAKLEGYVDRLTCEIRSARSFADRHRLAVPDHCDSIFLGGGTPSLLLPAQLSRIFAALREGFTIAPDAETTIEVAPGQLDDALLDAMLREGVNRMSLGVQSFVDREAHAVGRLHTAEQCGEEIRRLQRRGVPRLSLDLILGLPHQTRESWRESLRMAIDTGVGHISVYMLEVDEGSRLGRELIGPGVRYGAGAVPDDDTIADCYAQACETLAAAGLQQYEISNFAREAQKSRHNRKYWERRPYLGFGLDAHSMLQAATHNALRSEASHAMRFRNSTDLDGYLAAGSHASEGSADPELEEIDCLAAFEETVFLGLRLNEGLCIADLRRAHPVELVRALLERARELAADGLMHVTADHLRLTSRGRLLASSVFGDLLAAPAA